MAGSYAGHVKMRVKAMKGGMSGGTYASLSYVMEEAEKDAQVFHPLLEPYVLNPKDSPKGQDEPDLDKVAYDTDAKSWIAPFIMSVINTKVVRRSNALAEFPYGLTFKYDEAMLTGDGISGRLKGLVTTGVLGALMAGKSGSLWKKLIGRILPNPGEGPNKKARDNGFYNLVFICKMNDGQTLKGRVTGDRDPGYGSTSKMLGEAAVCLALDKKKCPDITGVLTPATALGAPYLKRLEDNAGLTFKLYTGI
ncbi:MAG: saccharopine dehydrogenase, partial [Candidatus Marinimicrobia bacterium]|nr:saccharopine dehydrogenase [Candidatus Neomarinimicrobiota bacterium]